MEPYSRSSPDRITTHSPRARSRCCPAGWAIRSSTRYDAMKHLSLIEPLEDRIAPAMILSPYTVTFQDGSGDTAVIRISKPLFKTVKSANKYLQWVDNNGNSITETYTGNGTAENLSEIDLLGVTAAQGMNISVKV